MYPAVRKLEDLSHPLITAAYMKRDMRGKTLIIETNFSCDHSWMENADLEALLGGLNELIGKIGKGDTPPDLVDIRMGPPHKKEPRPEKEPRPA